MLRELAARTPNVEVRQGVTVTALTRDAAGRPVGAARPHAGRRGGRGRRARRRRRRRPRLGGRPAGRRPRPRAAAQPLRLHGLLRGPGARRGRRPRADVDPRAATSCYCFPNDDGLTIAAAFLHKDRLPEFRADKEAAFLAAFDGLDRAPDLRRAHARLGADRQARHAQRPPARGAAGRRVRRRRRAGVGPGLGRRRRLRAEVGRRGWPTSWPARSPRAPTRTRRWSATAARTAASSRCTTCRCRTSRPAATSTRSSA